ncbi:hypothetical protein FHG87_013510 [Trinorchestia longiramus]|nr:hypothetical protein FHG87_013510 [Trinorchestia longiramus]
MRVNVGVFIWWFQSPKDDHDRTTKISVPPFPLLHKSHRTHCIILPASPTVTRLSLPLPPPSKITTTTKDSLPLHEGALAAQYSNKAESVRCLLSRVNHVGSGIRTWVFPLASRFAHQSTKLSQRPEQSVMQALESLNDGQVTDFLSGKAPLNLTMRLGDHMMLIQLQLSTVSPVQHHSSGSGSRSSSHHFTTLRRGYSSSSSSSSNSSSASSCTSSQMQHNNSSQLHQQNHQASSQKSTLLTPPTSTSTTSAQLSRHSSGRHHQHHHHHHHHHHRNASSNSTSGGAARHHHHHHGHHYHHSHPYYHNPYPQYQLLPQPHSASGAVQQSKSTTQAQPINLQQQQQQQQQQLQQQQQQQQHPKMSPPAHQNPPTISGSKNNSNVLVTSSCNSSTVSSHPVYSTPPRRSSSANNYSSPSFSSPASSLSSLSPSSPTTPWSPASFTPPPTSSLHSSSYYTNNSTNIAYNQSSSSFTNQQPQQHMTTKSSNSSTSELPIRVCPHTSVDDLDLSDLGLRSSSVGEDLSFSTRRPLAPSSVGGRVRGVSAVGLDTRALAEASRNLTQTLRQLSSEVLTNKPPASAGGHQGSSVAASHKKQTSSCNYTGSQRNNATPNAAPIHNVEASKPLNSIAPEHNNFSAASENSSSKGSFKSSRSTRTASSVRPNVVNTDKPSRPSTQTLPGAPVTGTGVTGAESPAGTHSFGDAKRGNSCSPHQPQGAIIESMQHHGKGVFSGTFSGTLNPALQDRQGRPKRDISTIIHILNDLLCATPHYTNTAAAVAAVAAANTSRCTAPASTAATSTSQTRSSAGEPKESVSAEDAATRSRVQHIQAMLEQRAERRRARRLARTAGSGQPYSLPSANLPKSKQQQPNSKPETHSVKNSILKGPSGETSNVSTKKSPEETSVLFTTGIESNIDVSAKSELVANADTSLSSQKQQQHQHQHLMRELLKGCVAASTAPSSALQHNDSGSSQSFPECESECKQTLENNYSGAAHLQQQQIHRSEVATLAVPTEPPTAMEVENVQVESQPAESSSMDVDTTLESAAEIDSNQPPSDGHVPLKLPQEQQQQQDSVQQRSQQPQQDQQPQPPQQQKQQSSQQQEASGDAEQQDTAKIVSLNSGTVMA